MSSEEDIYEIGAVLKDRKKRGQIEYLIRWKNFGAEEDSWEPASNLTSATPLLEEYKRNKSTRRRRSKSRSRSRSRTRTKLPVKRDIGTPEKPSRESTPIIAPPEEKIVAPAEDLETIPPSEDVTKEITEDSTTQLEEVADSQSVVTELSNEGVEQTPVTSFTSTRITTEKTEVYTPISESLTTVLTRRIKMRAAAKAAEIEEEENTNINDEVQEKSTVDSVDSVEPDEKKEESIASDAVTCVGNHSEKTWPIVVCIVGLIIVAISFLLGKFLVK